MEIANTCADQWRQTERIKKSELKEGDLVFFTSSTSPSTWHCGTYIGNGKFFHSSGRKVNLTISDLNTKYYLTNYKGAGRFKNKK
jgi:cell wall-associated NlpC family hydrolase